MLLFINFSHSHLEGLDTSWGHFSFTPSSLYGCSNGTSGLSWCGCVLTVLLTSTGSERDDILTGLVAVLMTYAWLWFCLQHFVCAKCEKPFLGHRHYERKGLAYCETHYNQVTPTSWGNIFSWSSKQRNAFTAHELHWTKYANYTTNLLLIWKGEKMVQTGITSLARNVPAHQYGSYTSCSFVSRAHLCVKMASKLLGVCSSFSFLVSFTWISKILKCNSYVL